MTIISPKLNILVVGPEGSGKTSLLNRFTNDSSPKDNTIDSLFMVYEKSIWYSGIRFNFSLQDTKSTDEFLFHRIPLYKEANLIFITFSIGCRASYTEACTKWLEEAKEYGTDIPIIFVGCQDDLYCNNQSINRRRLMEESLLSRREILDKMRTIKPGKYCECSALTTHGVKNIFEQTAQLYLNLFPLSPNATNVSSISHPFSFPSLALNSHHQSNSTNLNFSTLIKVMRILM